MGEVCTFLAIRKVMFHSNWNKHRGKYSGWIAQIIQHECDHLEGVII